MSDMEDAEFLECPEDTTVITEEKDTSVEVIGYEVKNGDREDIVQVGLSCTIYDVRSQYLCIVYSFGAHHGFFEVFIAKNFYDEIFLCVI